MRRLVSLALAGLLLLTVVPGVGAKAGASISAPDGLAFGDSFMPTWTEPNGYRRENGVYLFAGADCFQDGVWVYSQQFVNLDDPPLPFNADPFLLVNPPLWGGGGASCSITLYTFSMWTARKHIYASNTFEVTG